MTDASDEETGFEQTWETLEARETFELETPTETIRPATSSPEVSRNFDVRKLPDLTGSDDGVAIAQIVPKEVLGTGGMGEVRLAEQLPLIRDVAVKSVRRPATADAAAIEALLRESWVTGRLEHPNIVPVHTLGRGPDGEPLLVLKNIQGVSWEELLDDPSKSPRDFDSERPLDWHLEILSRVCDAVHFAHSNGIVHRDIKPENVMIGEFGEIYLLDWGIAVSLDAEADGRLPSVENITSPAGTPAYMAPEMATDDGDELSPRTDVFLLGATLHHVLTGGPPNEGDTVYEMMLDAYTESEHVYGEGVHPELAEVCRRAMHHDPGERYVDAEAFRKAVAHHMHHRESIQISERAEDRLDDLREALRGEASEADIYEAFGECRFGFEQALRVSPDNEEARDGLQEVLELMSRRELERGAVEAASLLINELPDPNPELEERLETAREELAQREEQYERLREMRHESDVDIARYDRSIAALLFGIVWGVTLPLFPRLASLAGMRPTAPTYLWFAVPVGVAVLAAGFLMRDRVLRNRANARMAGGFGIAVAAGVSVRALGTALGLEVAPIVTLEMASYAGSALLVAVTMDTRLVWVALPFVLGAAAAALLPGWPFVVFGVASFAAMLGAARAWWPASED